MGAFSKNLFNLRFQVLAVGNGIVCSISADDLLAHGDHKQNFLQSSFYLHIQVQVAQVEVNGVLSVRHGIFLVAFLAVSLQDYLSLPLQISTVLSLLVGAGVNTIKQWAKKRRRSIVNQQQQQAEAAGDLNLIKNDQANIA